MKLKAALSLLLVLIHALVESLVVFVIVLVLVRLTRTRRAGIRVPSDLRARAVHICSSQSPCSPRAETRPGITPAGSGKQASLQENDISNVYTPKWGKHIRPGT